MKLLLDTHALLWALEGGQKLSEPARAGVENPAHTILVSVVSTWEIALKTATGRMKIRGDLFDSIDRVGYHRLPLGFAEVKRLGTLPKHPRHKDPFDRLLVAIALEEGASLVTCDRAMGHYGVPVVW
jgi:PIN domain nuclease of toxin-antitoxin system